MNRSLRLLCALYAITSMFGVARASEPDLGTEAQRKAGRKIYNKVCAQCHGMDGDGNGVARAYFWPTPRDFTYGLFKIRTTASGELPTDDDLKAIIKRGMPYTGMPAWPGLSDRELANVVYYIKTFSNMFADPDFIVAPLDIPKPPKFSEESAAAGRRLYEENKCSDCHGEHGRGDGKSSPTLTNEWGEPIKPADLTRRWTFRGGTTRKDIYRTFTTGLNGTPMPSYADLLDEEDRWHLVDYVYAFSRDEPGYATVVVAASTEADLDLSAGEELFADASPAFFPVIGQVVEPGRSFYPSANAVEVRAVYNASEIAIMLTWHDMTRETEGANGPSMPAPLFDPDADDGSPAGVYSDAVAVQTPSTKSPGIVKPYFLFGDARNSVDLWFADMARGDGELFVGRGSQSVEPAGTKIPVVSSWEDGEWTVILKRDRHSEGGYPFDESTFVPVAFSIWDGFTGERGSKRGVTSWYSIYLEPVEAESRVIPVAGYGMLTLLAQLAVIVIVRRRSGGNAG